MTPSLPRQNPVSNYSLPTVALPYSQSARMDLKWHPQSKKVFAYVLDNDIWVSATGTGVETRLTYCNNGEAAGYFLWWNVCDLVVLEVNFFLFFCCTLLVVVLERLLLKGKWPFSTTPCPWLLTNLDGSMVLHLCLHAICNASQVVRFMLKNKILKCSPESRFLEPLAHSCVYNVHAYV